MTHVGAQNVCACPDRPGRLWSLWDIMNHLEAAVLCQICSNLATAQARFETARYRSVQPPQLLQEWMSALVRDVSSVKSIYERIGLNDGVRQFDAILGHLGAAGIDASIVAAEAQHARETLESEAYKLKYLYVRSDRIGCVDNAALFGADVYAKFESARSDIKDSGNCLAVELPTAAVFHLMRTAEHGLRTLAKILRVTLLHKGKRQAIEFADWEKVLTGIKNKIAAAHQLSPGPKRQRKLAYYSDAADHCTFMKDIWRNDVSHARKSYIDSEAIAVYGRVREFMVFVAAHLS